LDPIADKLLVTAALVLSSWAAIVIIAREFIITGLRLVAAGEGIVIAASKWGKIKTVTQIIAILTALLRGYLVDVLLGFPIDKVLMLVAVIATVYSAYDYIVKNGHVISQTR